MSQSSQLNEQKMAEFMKARFLCVLSTVTGDARPESAFVAYASSQGHEIVIGTSNQSRKYKNVTENKAVAIVIADQTGEVQYEGQAEVISVSEYESLVAAGSFGKLSGFDKYRNDPAQVYLLVKPTWIRFILHGETDQVAEFTEFAK